MPDFTGRRLFAVPPRAVVGLRPDRFGVRSVPSLEEDPPEEARKGSLLHPHADIPRIIKIAPFPVRRSDPAAGAVDHEVLAVLDSCEGNVPARPIGDGAELHLHVWDTSEALKIIHGGMVFRPV